MNTTQYADTHTHTRMSKWNKIKNSCLYVFVTQELLKRNADVPVRSFSNDYYYFACTYNTNIHMNAYAEIVSCSFAHSFALSLPLSLSLINDSITVYYIYPFIFTRYRYYFICLVLRVKFNSFSILLCMFTVAFCLEST